MPYVEIISSDGEFVVKPMSDETADHFMQQGGDPILIEDDVYEAWIAHIKQHRAFNALWIALQNTRARHLSDVRWRGVHFNCPGCGRVVKNIDPEEIK